MSTVTLPAVIAERQEPDGARVWLLGDNMVLRAVPVTLTVIPELQAPELITWTVTMFGVNGITATVTVADADLPLTVNCWCTLVVAAADGRLDEC